MASLAQTSKCHAQRLPAVDTHPDSEAPTPPGPGPPERAVRPRDALAALASGLPALADRTRSLRTWLPPGSFRLFFPPCPMLASPQVDLFTGSGLDTPPAKPVVLGATKPLRHSSSSPALRNVTPCGQYLLDTKIEVYVVAPLNT